MWLVGGGSALLGVADVANASSSGAMTAIITCSTIVAPVYINLFMWSLLSSSPSQVIQLRYNNTQTNARNFSSQVHDSAGSNTAASTSGTLTDQAEVTYAFVLNNGAVTLWANGAQIATATATSSGSAKFDQANGEFGIGIMNSTDGTTDWAAPPPYVGAFIICNPALGSTALLAAMRRCGASYAQSF